MTILDAKGFDIWASKYDEQMKNCDGYPFEGYYDVLSFVHNLIKIKNKKTKILDIGIGTGELTKVLYENGAIIYGLDFSDKMLKIARSKMPNANFVKFDFKCGIPSQIQTIKFDFIISSYALHHISDEEKISLILKILQMLSANGKIIIADIAFRNKQVLENYKRKYINIWDENEHYFIADELTKNIENEKTSVKYQQVSDCAGVFLIRKVI